jgi:putative tricarboxylic transport membrane protein
VLIGLFGLSEILRVLPRKNYVGIPEAVGRVVPPVKTLWRHARTALRSGLIGTIIGAIPGAGANVASFLSYDIGRRRATPEERAKWGTGSYEAIVCSEAASNANIGGSMLPTLTLGIPGSAAAAAFLAALELKNVIVGPTMQIEHPGLIYYIYWSLIIANFLMYGMAIVLVKPCVKLFSLPLALLMPLILLICIMGSYAVSLSYFDVYVMLTAGLVGYLLRRFGFPLAPLVLGAILGPVADENFRRALLVFEGKPFWSIFTDHPIGTLLLIVVLYTFYDGIFRRR